MSIHGIPLRQFLHARDLVGQRVVAPHRAVVRVVERLRAARRAHAVDRHDDEAEFGERLLVAARGRERARAHAARLRPRIGLVDDRVLLRRVEVRRPEHHAVDVRLAVARLHAERHRRLPARRPAASRCRPSRAASRPCPVAVAQHDHGRLLAASRTCRRGTCPRATAARCGRRRRASATRSPCRRGRSGRSAGSTGPARFSRPIAVK